jgi:hypothetical protein
MKGGNMPDQAQRNLLVGCVFTVLLFSTMLRLATRSADSSGLWLGLGAAILVAINWILLRLYRQVRELQATTAPGQHAA